MCLTLRREYSRKSKLRILCLHGYYNNAQVMKHQLDFYEKVFANYVDFEYLNAPIEVTYTYDAGIAEKFEGPFYCWGNFDIEGEKLHGCLDSMNYVIDYINKNGPYDGVLGFSQGTLICRLLLKNKELRKYAKALEYPLKFGVLISGPAYYHLNPFADNPKDYEILHKKYEQPLFYLYGINDPMFSYISQCVVHEGEYIEYLHGGKHKIPRLIDSDIEPLIKFMAKSYYSKYQKALVLPQPIDEEFHVKYFKRFSIPTKARL